MAPALVVLFCPLLAGCLLGMLLLERLCWMLVDCRSWLFIAAAAAKAMAHANTTVVFRTKCRESRTMTSLSAPPKFWVETQLSLTKLKTVLYSIFPLNREVKSSQLPEFSTWRTTLAPPCQPWQNIMNCWLELLVAFRSLIVLMSLSL